MQYLTLQKYCKKNFSETEGIYILRIKQVTFLKIGKSERQIRLTLEKLPKQKIQT